jgi:aryl-alcohol dehydrogenase-like predicted oxidoreductase
MFVNEPVLAARLAKMQHRRLGKTNLQVSVLSFGAGPVSTLMVGETDEQRQFDVVARALAAGVNWFDTAATYGQGASERNLGKALARLTAPRQVHIATKVRLTGDDLADIRRAVRRSIEGSLQRLQVSQVTLLQLHNSITINRDDEPTSITPRDVLQPGGVLDALRGLQQEGLVRFIGLTGIGQPTALKEVIASREFDTVQTPYHLLNPSSGRTMSSTAGDANYGNIMEECARADMGVFAIRVLAGGALADHPPSPHTLKTPFFPLALYERNREQARRLQAQLGVSKRLPAEAIRFALAHPHVHSAIIGFGDLGQIDHAIAAVEAGDGPLEWELEVAPLLTT